MCMSNIDAMLAALVHPNVTLAYQKVHILMTRETCWFSDSHVELQGQQGQKAILQFSPKLFGTVTSLLVHITPFTRDRTILL